MTIRRFACRSQPWTVVLFGVLALFATGCSDSNSPTGPSSSSMLAGNWSGTTEQGRPVSFTVMGTSNPFVSGFAADMVLEGVTAPGSSHVCLSSSLSHSGSASAPIVGNSFTITSGGSSLFGTFTMEGTLNPNGTAMGTVRAEVPPDFFGCGGEGLATWTAQRQ